MKTQGATGLYKVHLSYAKWKLSELVERAGQGETIGIARDGKKGDLLVEVRVTVPEKLTTEQQRLMKEFAAAGGMEY